MGLHRDFPSVRRLGAACKTVSPTALAEHASKSAEGSGRGAEQEIGARGGGPLYHIGACGLEQGEAVSLATSEGAWVVEAAGGGVASCEDRVTYVSSGRVRHGALAGEVQHRQLGTYHQCRPGSNPARPEYVQAHYVTLARARRDVWIAPVGAVARYLHTMAGTEVSAPVAMWEEGGLRVRLLWYVRLREDVSTQLPANAAPAAVTVATSALPGRWRVGGAEVAGRPVRPRALLVRRGTGRDADGAAAFDSEEWFGEVRVEGLGSRDERGQGGWLRGGGGSVEAEAAAADGGETGETEVTGRRVPDEHPFRLLIDVVPPTSGALRVEVVLLR